MDKNLEIDSESGGLLACDDLSDDNVRLLSANRMNSLEEDFHFHVAGLIKIIFIGEKNGRNLKVICEWLLRIAMIRNIKIRKRKIIKYLLK